MPKVDHPIPEPNEVRRQEAVVRVHDAVLGPLREALDDLASVDTAMGHLSSAKEVLVGRRAELESGEGDRISGLIPKSDGGRVPIACP